MSEPMTSHDKAPELLPCPFCGGKARFECNLHGWIVLCGERAGKCQVESRTLYFTTAKGAFAAWNTRTDPFDAQAQEIERLEETLRWYGEQVSNCNRHGSDGDKARDNLAKDYGQRAEAALQTTTKQEP